MIQKLYLKTVQALRGKDIAKIATAVASQGILSCTHFILSISMARYASKTEYGLYVVLFSVIGICAAYHNSIINVPLMVLFSRKSESGKREYVSSLSAVNNYLLMSLLLLFIFGYALYSLFINSSRTYILQSSIFLCVVMISLSKQFIHTAYFVLMDTGSILKMELFNSIAAFIGMGLLVYFDQVSALTGMMTLGVGYFAAYAYASMKRQYDSPKDGRSVKKSLMENWNYGKWAIIGTTSSLVQDRGYIYIVTGLLGLSALADISLAKLFLMPIGLLCLSSGKIVVAKGSMMLSQRQGNQFRNFVLFLIVVLLTICLSYVLFLISVLDQIMRFLEDKFVNTKGLLLLWGAFFVIYTVRLLLGTALYVYGQFKRQAAFDICGSALAITSCLLLIPTMGAPGAIISLMVGEFVTAALYLMAYHRCRIDYRWVT